MSVIYNLFHCSFLKVSFTIKELREMTKLEGCKAVFDPDDFRMIQEKLSSKIKMSYYSFLTLSLLLFLFCLFTLFCSENYPLSMFPLHVSFIPFDLHCIEGIPRPRKRLTELMCKTAL